ncbi:hypothetical protein E4U30_006030 [Claviceps sp. LM220 group G6]|nr:hypothetical protein E4U30_006030 [Claviceps sp. LM220 group G6]
MKRRGYSVLCDSDIHASESEQISGPNPSVDLTTKISRCFADGGNVGEAVLDIQIGIALERHVTITNDELRMSKAMHK